MESPQKCEHFIPCMLIVIMRGKLFKCWSLSKIPEKCPVFGEKCFITNIYYSHNVIYIILFWSPNCPLQDNATYFNGEHCLTYLQPSRPEQHNMFREFVCDRNEHSKLLSLSRLHSSLNWAPIFNTLRYF